MRPGEVYLIHGMPNFVMWGRIAPGHLALPRQVVEDHTLFPTYRELLRRIIAHHLGAE